MPPWWQRRSHARVLGGRSRVFCDGHVRARVRTRRRLPQRSCFLSARGAICDNVVEAAVPGGLDSSVEQPCRYCPCSIPLFSVLAAHLFDRSWMVPRGCVVEMSCVVLHIVLFPWTVSDESYTNRCFLFGVSFLRALCQT